jgi:hypothetical protein
LIEEVDLFGLEVDMGFFDFLKGGSADESFSISRNLYGKPASSGRRDDWRWFDSFKDIPKKGVWIIDPSSTEFKHPVPGYKPRSH